MRDIYPSTTNTPDQSGKPKGTYHIAANINQYEIQRGNNFEFVVHLPESLMRAGYTDTAAETITAGQEIIRMSVSQAAVPHFSQDPIEVRRGNSVLKYAGVPKFTDGSLTLNDYIGIETKSVLMAWQNLSYNVKTEKVGLAQDYKMTAELIEYTPDLQVANTWTLYGCWITSITEPEYNSDNNDKHTISVGISYDKAVLNTTL